MYKIRMHFEVPIVGGSAGSRRTLPWREYDTETDAEGNVANYGIFKALNEYNEEMKGFFCGECNENDLYSNSIITIEIKRVE